MKRKAEEEEGTIIEDVLPPEIWLKVIGYVEKDDMATHLALLGVRSSFVLYVSDRLDLFIAQVSKRFHARRNEITRTPVSHRNAPDVFLAENVIDWIYDAEISQLPLYTSSSTKAKIKKAVCKMAFSYASRCMMDERYKTAEHWSTLLSFLHLCQLHCLYVQNGDLEVLDSEDVLGTLFHIEKETNRVTSLLKSPSVRTINLEGTSWKTFEHLRLHAKEVVEKKYREKKENAKLYLYRYILDLLDNDSYVLNTTVYDILKDELKLREPRHDDPLSLVTTEDGHGGMQHILTEECGRESTNLFVYAQGDENALAIRLALKKNEGAICDEVFKRFTKKIDD